MLNEATLKLVPSKLLDSGSFLPMVGLGTWQARSGTVKDTVTAAIRIGYRHFDCAFIYLNEDEIGNAFAEAIQKNVVTREELFITNKVWNTFHSRDRVLEALDRTLQSMKLSYLDLYLIHFPMGYCEGGRNFPKDTAGNLLYSDVDYLETWKAMEELHRCGKVRNIGVSNFNIQQLERILSNSTVPVACNQIEVHVYLQNKDLVQFCQSKNVPVVAYSPLGSLGRPKSCGFGEFPPPLRDLTVKGIARKHTKQPAQVLLKFLLQQGLIVIPKSVNKERMKKNLEVFDFELDNEDMAELEKLDKQGFYRGCIMEKDVYHRFYPFDPKCLVSKRSRKSLF